MGNDRFNMILAEASELLRFRRFGEARNRLESIIAESQQNPAVQEEALLLYARLKIIQGIYSAKPSYFDDGLDVLKSIGSVKSLKAEYLRFKAHLHLGDMATAKSLADEISKGRDGDEAKPLVKTAYTILSLGEYYYTSNEFEKAREIIFDKSADVDFSSLDEYLECEILTLTIKVLLRCHDYSRLESLSEELLEKSKKLGARESEFVATNALAVHHGNRADFKEAMLHFRNAYDKSVEINFRTGTVFCLINIGTIYAHLFNYEAALNRYLIALNEFYDLLDKGTEVVILNNVGNLYFMLEKFDVAADYFQRSLDLAEDINYHHMMAHTLAQKSRALVALGNYEKALDHAQKSEKFLEAYGNREGKQINYINLGSIYYKLGNQDLALKYVSKGIFAAKQIGDQVTEIRGYRLMSNIYKDRKDFEKALDYQLIYSQAQEHYALVQRNRQAIDIELRYENQQKGKELALLAKYKDTLINQRNRIAEQNETLREVNRELRSFAYAVSHDLKEPLRMIGSYSGLIEKRYKGEFDESADEFFGFIREGVERMRNLLDDLLKYATIGKDEVEFTEVDMNEVMEVVIFNLTLAMKDSGAVTEFESLPVITSNKVLMTLLFQNLISNSVKFRHKDVAPIIKLKYRREENHHAFEVIDNGIGIRPEDQDRIFQVFQRLNKRSEYQGTGIGLSICTKIVEKLKGSISVRSTFGEGSVFTVLLPVSPDIPDDPVQEPFPEEILL